VFNHTTLAEAAAEFNRYNARKIVVAGTRAASIAIDGTFPKDGVDAFAQAAREAFNLHAKETSSEIVLSR
jgi:transmembrane sensor